MLSKFVCALCRTRIDLSLEHPHPASATRGHVVPTTRGGSDEVDNRRLEHFNCNVRKGDRLDGELSLPFDPPKLVDAVNVRKSRRRHRKGCRRGARIGGRNAQKRHRGRPEQRAWARRGALAANAKRKETGQYQNPEYRNKLSRAGEKGGLTVTHNRYHVARRIYQERCKLCRKAGRKTIENG